MALMRFEVATGRSRSRGAAPRLDGVLEEYGRLLRGAIGGFCPRRLGVPYDDVEQEARQRLRRALSDEGPIANLASHAYRSAAAAAVDAMRRVRARRDHAGLTGVHPDREGGAEPAPAVPGPPAEDLAWRRRQARAAERALERLAENRRRVVGLHLQGFSAAEIGELVGWTEAKVRNLASRGLAELRARLQAAGADPQALEAALRAAARAAARRRDPTAGCPPAEALAELAAGDAPASRELAANHFAACHDCAEEYRAVVVLREWTAARLGRLAADSVPPPWALRRVWGTAVAAALLAAAAGIGASNAGLRGDGGRSGAASRLPFRVTVPFVYTVEVQDTQGRTRWSSAGLRPDAGGRIRLVLPRGLLAAECCRLRLAGRSGGTSTPLDEYALAMPTPGRRAPEGRTPTTRPAAPRRQ